MVFSAATEIEEMKVGEEIQRVKYTTTTGHQSMYSQFAQLTPPVHGHTHAISWGVAGSPETRPRSSDLDIRFHS
jgi:hypothetical protein